MTTSLIYEPELRVNPNTRKIFVPAELYNIGVSTDDNSEIIKIRAPRYFDGFDFSNKDCTITYNNALMERGIYEVKDIEPFEDSLLLSWCISNHVTKKTGKIHFVVEFKTSNAEHNKTYSWSTAPAELNVLPWLDHNVKYTDDQDGDKTISHLMLFSHKHHNMDVLNQLTQPMMNQIQNLVSSVCNNDVKYQTENEVLEKISGKVDKVSGMGLSANDYNNMERQKLLNMPNIVFSTAIPDTLDANTICFVYEE